MRHRKNTFKIGRTSSHRRCMIANMLKSLVIHGQIVTTVRKAKQLKRDADKLITLSKGNDLAALREAKARMMVRFNKLTPKEARAAKKGDTSSYNDDRFVMEHLEEICARYNERQGGYTRLVRLQNRVGDNAELCMLQFV